MSTNHDGVLFVLNSLAVGGMERMTVTLSAELARRGNLRPVIACLGEAGDLADEARAAGAAVHENLLHHKFDFAAAGRLRDLFEAERIAAAVIVDAGGDRMFWTSRARGRSASPALLLWAHRMPIGGHRSIELLNRGYIKRLDAIAVIGPAQADALAEVEKLPRDRMHVVPNGLSAERLERLADWSHRDETRRHLDTGEDEVVVMCVANPRPIKRVDLFCEAAKRLAGDDRFRFVLVGDGPDRDAVAVRIAELELNKPHFRWLGRREDVEQLWPAADVGVCCTGAGGSEVMSVAMLEAMAAGTAFVSTPVGEHPSVCRHEETGLLVMPDSADALAETISDLADDPVLRERLGEAGSQHIRGHHTATAMAQAFEACVRYACEIPLA